ncbi:hypothetical protein Q31b_41970 [Novipirellula aureliae]|uniref:Uncharacterized protein n=1 Tax=Novipirellula aureliae TaxID=2527966 RepID=A0A5C6DSE5_9BACT|nr:hypothetical protein [Novipirellula aureliae]TWU39114.1 hypothetical protein Q31b_41970 [Novipirellula aureliae]
MSVRGGGPVFCLLAISRKELVERARSGEVIGDGSRQMMELVYQLDCALNGQEYTHQWYGVRWKRLHDLLEAADIPENLKEQACRIMAHGSADSEEPPSYDQQLNHMRQKIIEAIAIAEGRTRGRRILPERPAVNDVAEVIRATLWEAVGR